MLRPAAVRSLVGDPALIRDALRQAEFPELAETVRSAMSSHALAENRRREAVVAFSGWLRSRLAAPSAEALLANSMVEAVESDPSLLTVTDLASHLHISTRSVQRLAAMYIGLPPAALIRRRRLQEAADRLRREPELSLAELAQEYGYADHAHLTNDFRTSLGFTPSSYKRSLPST